jgi:hypothetical protein
MTRQPVPLDCHPSKVDIQRFGIWYEIYPDLTLQAEAPVSWFEIALHAEVDQHRPSGDPKSRESFSVLMSLADLLIERIQGHAPYRLDLSASYHSLRPNAAGLPAPPALSRTISLVFSDVGPYTILEEPPILRQLRAELGLLRIPRLDHLHSGELP